MTHNILDRGGTTALEIQRFLRLLDLDKMDYMRLNALLTSPGGLRHRHLQPTLSPQESGLLEKIKLSPLQTTPSFHSHIFVVLKATRLCNLRCRYCHSWKSGPGQVMPFDVLAETVRSSQGTPNVTSIDYVWHGGETTLLKRAYFEKALWLQQLFRQPGQRIENSIQTNGTQITSEWASFFADHAFRVGVSIDGIKDIHDSVRVDKKGRGTFDKVKHGLKQLQAKGVPFGLLVVVNEKMSAIPAKKLLTEIGELGAMGASLLNSIPDNQTTVGYSEKHFAFGNYVEFLRGIFAEWKLRPDYYPKIRELSSIIDVIHGSKPTVCTLSGNCMGQFLTIEPNGTTSACDKYIGDNDFVFAHRSHSPFTSDRLLSARTRQKDDELKLVKCPHFQICKGGCPHDNRLQQIFDANWIGTCCGLAPLISDIKAWLQSTPSNGENLKRSQSHGQQHHAN